MKNQNRTPGAENLVSIGISLLELLLSSDSAEDDTPVQAPAQANFVSATDEDGRFPPISQTLFLPDGYIFNIKVSPETHARVFEFVKNARVSGAGLPGETTAAYVSEIQDFESSSEGGSDDATLTGKVQVVVTPTAAEA